MVIGWNGDGIMDGWNHTATPTTITIVSIGGSSINLGWGEVGFGGTQPPPCPPSYHNLATYMSCRHRWGWWYGYRMEWGHG